MKALGIALWIVGYAMFYSGASNLFTGGQGWGFLQALLNSGTKNQSGSLPNSDSGSKGSGKSGGKSDPGSSELGGITKLLNGLSNLTGGIIP